MARVSVEAQAPAHRPLMPGEAQAPAPGTWPRTAVRGLVVGKGDIWRGDTGRVPSFLKGGTQARDPFVNSVSSEIVVTSTTKATNKP